MEQGHGGDLRTGQRQKGNHKNPCLTERGKRKLFQRRKIRRLGDRRIGETVCINQSLPFPALF